MRKLVLAFVLLFLFTGCCTHGVGDEDLLRAIRKDMVESIRPAMVDAMDKAKGPDGKPIYIDAFRNEKVNLIDRAVLSIDRVYPNKGEDGKEAPYKPEPLPWKKKKKEEEEKPDGGDQ